MSTFKDIRKFVILNLWLLSAFSLIDAKTVLAQEFAFVKDYKDGSFTTGWTHVVNTKNGIIYYHSGTGSGAIGWLNSDGSHTTVTAGFNPGWTQIVDTPKGVFFYNAQSGSGALGRIDRNGNNTAFKTFKTYPDKYFAPGWTNIVSTANGILFYNAGSGAGAVRLIR